MLRLLLLLLLIPSLASAAISFDQNGRWATTFDYADCFQQSGGGGFTDCQAVATDGTTWDWSDNPTQGNYSGVNTAGNHPLGTGGAARFWKSSGGVNDLSGSVSVIFPARQQELWIRWYERYEEGFQWNGDIDVKTIYFNTNPTFSDGFTQAHLYAQYYWSNYGVYNSVLEGVGRFYAPDARWDVVHPNGVSDGSWTAFEMYLKMDTDTTNGKVKLWVDGNLMGSRDDMNWSGGNSTYQQGWTHFHFHGNQKDPGLDRPYYVDYDDFVVYSQTPSNTDASGNPFIGPIGWGNGGGAALGKTPFSPSSRARYSPTSFAPYAP